MLGVAEEDYRPVIKLILKLNIDDDLSKIGSWGIFPLCCGAMAGQSPSWKARLIEEIDLLQLVSDKISKSANENDMALHLAEYIRKWASDEGGISLAKKRVQEILQQKGLRNLPDKTLQALESYFGLAITLNSIKLLDEEEFLLIQKWAEAEEYRWVMIFFAAGLVLSGEKDFPWDKMGSALLGMFQGQDKMDLKATFNHYSAGR